MEVPGLRDRVCVLAGYPPFMRGKIGYVRSIKDADEQERRARQVLVCDCMAETFDWAEWINDSDVAIVQKFDSSRF